MLSGWMLYCVLVSALLFAAGLLLEIAGRRLHLPQRGIWAGALVASVLVPLLAGSRAAPTAALADSPVLIGEIVPLPSVAIPMDAGTRWGELIASLSPADPLLAGVWVGASAVLLIMGLLSMLRLRRAMRDWVETSAPGRRVLVSESTGPAVVGFLNGAIVLPRWAMAGDSDLCRLMVAHEEEHLHARDPLLVHAATLLVVLLPWNLPLWWQLRRLKLAVEVDCDARVLGRGSDLRTYATLLLEVGRRHAGLDHALVAFAEPASFLERRIRIMTADRRRRGWLLAAGCAALSVAFAAGACAVERPADRAAPEPPVTGPSGPLDADRPAPPATAADTVIMDDAVVADSLAEAAGSGDSSVSDEPAFTPRDMDRAPQEPAFSPRDKEPMLQNTQQFTRALEQAYPSMLRDAGIGGRVLLWVYVDEEGRVADSRVYESSGYPQLDEAAMRVMETARFTPAELDGRPVAVWVALPVSMNPSAPTRAREAPSELPPPAERREGESAEQFTGRLSERPAFTPREVEPGLTNVAEFTAALERAYPAAMKEAGVGGRVLLWIFVNEQGRVANVQLYETSGYPALDDAATRTMRTVAKFSPARNRGEVVPVWVAVPVTFATAQM